MTLLRDTLLLCCDMLIYAGFPGVLPQFMSNGYDHLEFLARSAFQGRECREMQQPDAMQSMSNGYDHLGFLEHSVF